MKLLKNRTKYTWIVAEYIACIYLKIKGLKILKRNFNCRLNKKRYTRGGEIDIIACDDERIIFVEVRMRKGDYIQPLESITTKKIYTMRKTAIKYLTINKLIESSYRFDCLGITLKPFKITWYKDIC